MDQQREVWGTTEEQVQEQQQEAWAPGAPGTPCGLRPCEPCGVDDVCVPRDYMSAARAQPTREEDEAAEVELVGVRRIA